MKRQRAERSKQTEMLVVAQEGWTFLRVESMFLHAETTQDGGARGAASGPHKDTPTHPEVGGSLHRSSCTCATEVN